MGDWIREDAGVEIVVEEGTKMNVLVAIDASDESFNALQWALDNILTHDAPVVGQENKAKVISIVYVMDRSHRLNIFGAHAETAKQQEEQDAARILSRAYEICKEKSVNAKTLILEGDPKEKICQGVEEMNIDLLIIGSRGLGQIKRALLGSVSDYCIRHASCPVLVVKPPPAVKTTH